MATSIGVRVARLCVALGALTMFPAAHAIAGSCTGNFKEIQAPDGATFYMTSSTYSGLDARGVLEEYRAIVAAAGYIVFSPPDYGSPSPSMGIGKPPSGSPVSITVDPQASSISLATIVARGQRADAAQERARLCALAAEFDARRPGTEPRQTAEQQQMHARTTIAEPVRSLRMLQPSVPFDRAAAKAALEPGRSVIRGQGCGFYDGTLAYAAGSTVLLYPATPHLEQLLQLAKKARPGKDQVVPDPDVFATRMEATANAKGEFQFSQMRPGRYFLMTNVAATFIGSRDVYAGRVETGYGAANVFRSEGYAVDAGTELSEWVEVRADGDVVKVTLQPPVSANPFRKGMRGSILGCRQL